MLWLSKACTAVKEFCIKYWKALVAFVLVVIGYVIGRRNDNTRVIEEDANSKVDAIKR